MPIQALSRAIEFEAMNLEYFFPVSKGIPNRDKGSGVTKSCLSEMAAFDWRH